MKLLKEKGLSKEMFRVISQKLINKLVNTNQDVDVAHILDVLSSHKGVCEYHGTALKFADVTIERIDPFKGYVRGNVALVSQVANTRKGHTVDTFVKDEAISLDTRIKVLEKTLQSMRKIRKDEEEKVREAERLANEQLKNKSIEYLTEQLKSMTPAQLATVVKVYQAEQQKK